MNYITLPSGYVRVKGLDFMRNRAQMKAMLILSVLLVIVPATLGLILVPVAPGWRLINSVWYGWLLLGVALIAYVPLHELTHGVVMFALSGVPPKYGLQLPYAYAGSTVWFDKKSHIITALAPVVVWGVALQIALWRLPPEWFWPVMIVQISNLSGSAGDIYTAWYLSRLRGDYLIQDTGVRMTIMKKDPSLRSG